MYLCVYIYNFDIEVSTNEVKMHNDLREALLNLHWHKFASRTITDLPLE